MNTTHLAPEIRSEIAAAVRTAVHGHDINVRDDKRHWRIARCTDGTVIVFERKLGRRFVRWQDADIRDLLAEG
jgi:hypothetical protein